LNREAGGQSTVQRFLDLQYPPCQIPSTAKTATMRTALQLIKRLLMAFAGFLGGAVFGCILSLVLVSLRGHFPVDLLPLKLLIPIFFFGSLLAGISSPRFFMMFFLCPLSWLLSGDDSGEGHPSGNDTGFLINMSYVLGLIFLVAGALFSLTWVAGLGILGIGMFAVAVFRDQSKNPHKQAGTPNS
jgi:hypothetical protein